MPLTLRPEDSGEAGAEVVYRAYPGEKPILSGGVPLRSWAVHDATRSIYKATTREPFDTRQLYVDGKRATRARSVGGLTAATVDALGHTTTDVQLADWQVPSDLELVYHAIWTNPRCGVARIGRNAAGTHAVLTMKQPGFAFARGKGITSVDKPWYYENAYELLDEPGEWYLDRRGAIDGTPGTFYYIPRQGEDLATVEVVAPRLQELLVLEGTVRDRVHHVRFEGLGLHYATWLRPSTDRCHSDAQNNVLREKDDQGRTVESMTGGAVVLRATANITFERCELAHLGNTALFLTTGSQDNRIEGNRFIDLSAGAVMIGEVSYAPSDIDNFAPADPRYATRNNDVLNNFVRGGSLEYRSAAAIGAAYPIDTDVSHNDLGTLPYTGIHFGWGWDRIAAIATPQTRNNRITFNRVDAPMRALYDGGAIYTLGPTSGARAANVIADNFLNSTWETAVYLDEKSDYWKVERNVQWWGGYFLKVNHASNVTVTDFHTTRDASWVSPGATGVTITGTVETRDAGHPVVAAVRDAAGLTDAYADIAY